MVLNSQPFAAPVSGSSRLSTVSKWWTLQKVFVVRHSRGFSLYTDAPAGMLFMVVQASDRLQSSSKAALRTSSGNQPTTRSQDAATSRQEPEVGSVMGESSAFTTAASFVDPAGEDTHVSQTGRRSFCSRTPQLEPPQRHFSPRCLQSPPISDTTVGFFRRNGCSSVWNG